MNKKRIAKQKLKKYLEEHMDEIFEDSDIQVPSAEEMFVKLEPHFRRIMEEQNERKKYRAARLRPVILCVAVILIVSMVAVKPVRAGIWGAITDFYRIIVRDTQPTFVLDMPEATLVSSETGDGYTISFYQIDEYRITLLAESSGGSEWTWVDRAGTPYIVNGLQIGSAEALCYEDEGGHYAIIEIADKNIIVSIDKGDRVLFADVLRSIIIDD